MISHGDATKQINRLVGLEFWGQMTEPAVNELVKVLMQAETVEISDAAVSQWIQHNTKRPTPADLAGLIEGHNRDYLDRTQGHHAACLACCDSGLLVVDGRFAACRCETGSKPFVQDWVGKEAY